MKHILPYVNDNKKLAWEMAKISVRALYFEVKSYPKPGLVSFVDSGAHQDMNGEKFYLSLFSLRHYFFQITFEGLLGKSFSELKKIALEAEEKMLKKTKGINTHRGALFSLGLFCISTARLLKRNKEFHPKDLHKKIIEDWQEILKTHQTHSHSHGSLVSDKNNIINAKEMAIQGYPIVFQIFPFFLSIFEKEHLPINEKMNISCLQAYLHLLIHIDDTNILYRKGIKTLYEIRKKAQSLLFISCFETQRQKAILLHKNFSKMDISPGGVGDLIGVLIFLGQLFSEKMRCHC